MKIHKINNAYYYKGERVTVIKKDEKYYIYDKIKRLIDVSERIEYV